MSTLLNSNLCPATDAMMASQIWVRPFKNLRILETYPDLAKHGHVLAILPILADQNDILSRNLQLQ